MTASARSEVVAHYRARRDSLLLEARDDERNRRPIRAARKREAALLLSRAITDEELNLLPSGLGGFA